MGQMDTFTPDPGLFFIGLLHEIRFEAELYGSNWCHPVKGLTHRRQGWFRKPFRGWERTRSAVEIGPRKLFQVSSRQGRWKGQEKNIPAKTGSYAIQARLFVRDKYIYQAQRIYSHACTVKALERNSKIRDFIDASRDHSTTKRNIFPRFPRSVDRIPPAHGRVPPKTPQNRGVFVHDN